MMQNLEHVNRLPEIQYKVHLGTTSRVGAPQPGARSVMNLLMEVKLAQLRLAMIIAAVNTATLC